MSTAFPWPNEPHPDTKEKFTMGEMRHVYNHQEGYHLRPSYPERIPIVGWDEWGDAPTYGEPLTDEEWEIALQKYAEADARWLKTMGKIYSKGPVILEGEFMCKSGSYVKGTYHEKTGWFWTEVTCCQEDR